MIVFDGKENIFKIDTENNSYVMGIIDCTYLLWKETFGHASCVSARYGSGVSQRYSYKLWRKIIIP